MKILTAFGKENTFTFGYLVDKRFPNNRCISLIFFEIVWNVKSKRFGVGIGIPFVAAIGVFF